MDWMLVGALVAGAVVGVVLALRDRRRQRRWDAQRLVGRTSERRVAYGAEFRRLSADEQAYMPVVWRSAEQLAREYPRVARRAALTTEELRARAERPWWERYDHLAHERPRERAVDPRAFFAPPLLSVMGGCPCCEDRRAAGRHPVEPA